MITYKFFTAYSLKVLLDGKLAGHVNEVFDFVKGENGKVQQVRRYQYFPLGQKTGGTKYLTMGECKRSLEMEPACEA